VVGGAVWLPLIALSLGLIFGGSLQTADLGSVLIKQLGSIALAVVVINLWEETVWAGFFQTRLEARFNFVVAAVLTALPFAGVCTSRCCSWMIRSRHAQY
jgi:membrane protease YdiL (CAAX protease family)